MKVLILSKTHFGKSVCVGGLVLDNNTYVRLLNPGGWYQYADTPFNIGDIWDISFTPSEVLREPHNEDVIILSQKYLSSIGSISDFIKARGLTIWKGPIDNIFEGKLRWAKSGAGYLSVNYPDYPSNSVGFWLSNKPLNYEDEHYFYPTGNIFTKRALKYKGIPNPISIIPANTLLRVSLPKWWKPSDSDVEERCYLQLSGWYDYEEDNNSDEPTEYLPF